MGKKTGILLLAAAAIFIILPGVAMAQSLELGLNAFGGLAGGTTDNSSKTGSLGPTFGGGMEVTFYFVDLGGFRIGLSSGLEYAYQAYEYIQPLSVPFLGDTDLTAYAKYSYLTIPVTAKGALKLTDALALTLDAGAYFGVFLGGKSQNTWDPEIPLAQLTDGEANLDDSNTPSADIGLRFALGVDIEVVKNLLLSPGVLFDFGLSDITKDVELIPDARDTFWRLAAGVAVVYRLF